MTHDIPNAIASSRWYQTRLNPLFNPNQITHTRTMARPRTYIPEKVTPIRVAPPREQGDRTIPLDAPLLSLKAASEALTEQYGDGFSEKTLRRYVDNGEWARGWHYVRVGRKTKIYLEAVREWVIGK